MTEQLGKYADLSDSHLSSGQARLTSAAGLTSSTFRSTNTGSTTLTSGSL